MRVLLVAMPDTADVVDYFARLPNLALVNLAGNLPGHEVRVLDLVLSKPRIRPAIENALRSFRPQFVGLSAMTFQFERLLKVARFIRNWDPAVRIAAGGYHTTLLAREIAENDNSLPLDFMVRGEGEITLNELVSELEKREPDLTKISGLSYFDGAGWIHNPERPLSDPSQLPLPNRQARFANDFYMLHYPMDVAETSRGCPFKCKFCSITQMYGRTFRRFPEERIVADLMNIRRQGTKAVFFVDDNITYDIDHFRSVCRAIGRHGLNDMFYLVQATAVGIAQHPELVADMDKANFRAVFVGFESMSSTSLQDVNKPTNPQINRTAAGLLRRHNMAIIAGCIVGYPDDTRASVVRNIRLIKELKPDLLYAQYLTPYPKTRLREEMLEEGLVENIDDFTKYDGFTCNIRTRHLAARDLYRTLKQEALKSNFDPSLISSNTFLRNTPRPFIKSIIRSVISNLYNLLYLKQRDFQSDL